jgi:nitrogen fixation/metabolism regulation signal transduction histidine kinase
MKRSRTRRLGAEARLILALWVVGLLGAGLHAGAQAVLDWEFGSALVALLTLVIAVASAGYFLKPWHATFRALSGLVSSYRDGDFSIGIARTQDGALGELIDAHNELGRVLREQRLHLVQRELLLDTMVQHTPVSMLLLDPSGYVVHANLAARAQLNAGRRLEGDSLGNLLPAQPAALRELIEAQQDGVCSLVDGQEEVTWQVLQREFRLNGRAHRLLLMRQLTAELRRAEVQAWKKVIRVISHEINNSLAPIASLAHSGKELLRRGQSERLDTVLETIEERAHHLDGFIQGYATFARLPAPRLQKIRWSDLLRRIQAEVLFHCECPLDGEVRVDPAQMEQALLNLLRNAHESGTSAEEVELRLARTGSRWQLEVLDRGTGMSDSVLAQALLPFYSTKRSGTGLGLALTREIVEAHGGEIRLHNREGGGLSVQLHLPAS